MITDEKLHKVYDKATEENIFKTKELLEMGFTSNDLTKLVKDKVLSRVKRGEYILVDIESLFYYGKKAIQEKEYGKANAIFTACHKINPKHERTLFQLFLNSINNEEYEESLKYLDQLMRISTECYQKDYNVYLVLLDHLIFLPNNYHNYISGLNYEDLEVSPTDKRIEDKEYQNKIRRAIFDNQNALALELLLVKNEDSSKIHNIAIRVLLYKIMKKQKIILEKAIDLIRNDKYEELVILLSVENKSENLNFILQSILAIAKDILKIKETKEVFLINNIYTNNIIRAIEYHNYALALSLSQKRNNSKNISDSNDALTLILKAIMREIKQVENQNKLPNKSLIVEIESNILNRDMSAALESIKTFLASINKSEYEHLAVLLTKLCLLRKGKNFNLIIDFLNGLRNEEIILNSKDIIKEYETSKKNNNFEKANLLFEIIKELEKLGIIQDTVSKLTNESNSRPISKELPKESEKEIETIPTKEEIKILTPIPKELTIEEKEFMAEIYKRLEEDSLIILDESDSSKIDIETFNKEYNFKAHAFRIDHNCIVVKITRYVNPKDAREYTRLGDEAFKNGNWEETIKAYQELLPIRNTFTRVYANIGLAYMNLNNIPEAIKYLTIATGLSKLNPCLKFDYSKLINELKVRLATNIKKEQNYGIDNINLNDYYGVTKIKDVVFLIEFSCLTLDEACHGLMISTNERNMIGLLLARDCYARGAFELGDDYIRQVEESAYKSKQVLKLLESLKENKLLYQDKVNESYKPLMRVRELTDLY